MLRIMIRDQYPNCYKVLEIYTGYFDSLDIMILFSYPSSIVITRDYCICFCANCKALKTHINCVCEKKDITGSSHSHAIGLYKYQSRHIICQSFLN